MRTPDLYPNLDYCALTNNPQTQPRAPATIDYWTCRASCCLFSEPSPEHQNPQPFRSTFLPDPVSIFVTLGRHYLTQAFADL